MCCLLLLCYVNLCLVSSVLRQEIGWEERPRNDLLLLCRMGRETLTQSINQPAAEHTATVPPCHCPLIGTYFPFHVGHKRSFTFVLG